MGDTSSINAILDFLRRKGFSGAEAAFRSELSHCPDENRFQKQALEEKERGKMAQEGHIEKLAVRNQESRSWCSSDISKELIVKEIECGTVKNGKQSDSKSSMFIAEHDESVDAVGLSDKGFIFSRGRLGKINVRPDDENGISEQNQSLWALSSGKFNAYGNNLTSELKGTEQRKRSNITQSKDSLAEETRSRNEEILDSSSNQWNECTVKTVLSFSSMDVLSDKAVDCSEKGPLRKTDVTNVKAAIKEQVDEVGRSLYLAKFEGICEKKNLDDLSLPPVSESQKEELQRLSPVKLKSEDKLVSAKWEERFDHDGPSLKISSADSTYLIGSYLDVPVGQDICSSGVKRTAGGNWLCISQGITEDTSDLVSGFATIGGLSESTGYPNDYWDSDEYHVDDIIGYKRQRIEDEAWFLAHEIDYPSDNEKGTGHGSIPDPRGRAATKVAEDDQSFVEEDSYYSGEQYICSKNMEPFSASNDPIGLSVTEVYEKGDGNDVIAYYDGQLMDEEELNLTRSDPVWQGFVTQPDDLILLGDGKIVNECGRPFLDDGWIDDDQRGSVRSIGIGINSDVTDFGSEVWDSFVGGSSDGDLDYLHDHEVGLSSSRRPQNKTVKDRKKPNRQVGDDDFLENDKGVCVQLQNNSDVGFSFAPPMRNEAAGSRKQIMSSTGDIVEDYAYAEKEHVKKADDGNSASVVEEDVGASLEDEEATALQEQVRQIKAQEEEFETFHLKIVHRKSRTGFEEDKSFHVGLNSVIAGCYHVTEYLGSAAFSKAIQAHA